MKDLNHLFTLRIKPFYGEPLITIDAYDGGRSTGKGTRIDVEVTQDGKVIFEKGNLWCGTPAYGGPMTTDGNQAKELVMSLVAMKPGDTDKEYFSGYTQEQLDFVDRYGEQLSMIRMNRYCDENGNVKTSD